MREVALFQVGLDASCAAVRRRVEAGAVVFMFMKGSADWARKDEHTTIHSERDMGSWKELSNVLGESKIDEGG